MNLFNVGDQVRLTVGTEFSFGTNQQMIDAYTTQLVGEVLARGDDRLRVKFPNSPQAFTFAYTELVFAHASLGPSWKDDLGRMYV